MLTVLGASLPVFALIALGFAFGRGRRIGPPGIAALNNFTVWLALPALLFLSLAQGDWARLAQPGFLLAYGGATFLGFGAGILICMPRGAAIDRVLAGLAAGYSNAGFIGIPLLGQLLGPVGIDAAVLGSIVTISILFAVAILCAEASLHRGSGATVAIRRTFASMIRNPLVLAPALGAIWHLAAMPLPIVAGRLLGLLSAAAAPCALVTIGAFLALPGQRAEPGALARTLLIKLFAMPAIAGALIWAAAACGHPVPRVWAIAAMLMAALPTGTGPFMLAELYGREAALTSRTILLSTMIGAISVSLLAALLLG